MPIRDYLISDITEAFVEAFYNFDESEEEEKEPE